MAINYHFPTLLAHSVKTTLTIMMKLYDKLFEGIAPNVALFADVWRVPMPTATLLCQDACQILAGLLECKPNLITPKPLGFASKRILSQPLTLGTLPALKTHALPLTFFDENDLKYWRVTHPAYPAQDTLCLVGVVLMWMVWHQLSFEIGVPVIKTKSQRLPKTKLSYEQKVWLGVFVFLGVLGLWIFQTISQTPPPPSNPKPKTEQHQKIPDVAIIRIDDNKD